MKLAVPDIISNSYFPAAAAVELGLDVGEREADARRAAVHHAAERRAVAFAPGRDAEQMTESIVRHASNQPCAGSASGYRRLLLSFRAAVKLAGGLQSPVMSPVLLLTHWIAFCCPAPVKQTSWPATGNGGI